jgi:hypothetical protein
VYRRYPVYYPVNAIELGNPVQLGNILLVSCSFADPKVKLGIVVFIGCPEYRGKSGLVR